MRILHVIPTIDQSFGGPAHAVIAMARLLGNAGITQTVLSQSGTPAQKMPENVEFVRVHGGSYRRVTGSSEIPRWIWARAANYDVIHIHGIMSFDLAATAFVAHYRKVPFILRPHGTLDPFDLGRKRVRKWVYGVTVVRQALQLAACVHCTTTLEADRLVTYGVRTRKCVAGLPIDALEVPTSHRRLRNESQALQVVFLSRIDPKKNLEGLLFAVAQALATGRKIALTIAGRGVPSYEKRIRGLIGELDIESAVTFAGFLTGSAKGELLASGDVFALPSKNENFGVAAVEALSAGLPVIGSPGLYIAREIESHGAGVIVQGQGELTAAICELADDKTGGRARLDLLSSRARSLATDVFGPDRCLRDLTALYDYALGR